MIVKVTAAVASLLLAVPAVAQAADGAVQGITLAQESADQWRASKLIGVQLYGPDNKSVGKITDILMSHDGAAQDVVVGVGGFLGIGEKDVAIPFASVNFTDKPMAVATPAPVNGGAMSAGMSGTPTGMAPAGTGANGGAAAPTVVGLGTPADTLGTTAMPAGAAAAPPSTAYPDHGTIAYTADQLKNAPAFHFAK